MSKGRGKPLDANHSRVQGPHVVKVTEDEGSLHIKTAGDDVLCVLVCESPRFFAGNASAPSNTFKPMVFSPHFLSTQPLQDTSWSLVKIEIPYLQPKGLQATVCTRETTTERCQAEIEGFTNMHRNKTQDGGWQTHFQRVFSSSVSWMTKGTRKASWSHLVNMKGTRCPKCSASEEGPCSSCRFLRSEVRLRMQQHMCIVLWTI